MKKQKAVYFEIAGEDSSDVQEMISLAIDEISLNSGTVIGVTTSIYRTIRAVTILYEVEEAVLFESMADVDERPRELQS